MSFGESTCKPIVFTDLTVLTILSNVMKFPQIRGTGKEAKKPNSCMPAMLTGLANVTNMAKFHQKSNWFEKF